MVNPDDAPDGMKAEKTPDPYSCRGCFLLDEMEYCTLIGPYNCISVHRDDGEHVIFVIKDSCIIPPRQKIKHVVSDEVWE